MWEELVIFATSGQDRWAAAIAEKSTGCASAMAASAAAGGGRLKASATTFSWPGMCLMSDVNSAMKESCRCWRADHGGVVRNRDVTSGLWSVSRRNWCPSSKNLKCLTALKAASSSLSKVEYLVPTPDNFLE